MGEFYCKLAGAFAEDVVLAKRLEYKYWSKPLEDVIRYMCNHTPDNLNSESNLNPGSCYTANEVNKALIIEQALDEGLSKPSYDFIVEAQRANGGGAITLGKNNELSDITLSEYQSDIKQQESLDGQEYELVELIAGGKSVGGLL